MSLNANNVPFGSGHKFEPIEPGNYLARVVHVVDLGLQPQRPFKGVEKPPIREVLLTYELVNEFLKDEDGEEMPDKPRHISEYFAFHNIQVDRAKSTVRYKSLDPAMKFKGDFTMLVNLPCTVTIVNNQSKTDPSRVYSNVASVTPPMKGIPVPPLVNSPKVFVLSDPDIETFNELPEWIRNKITSNLEYAGSKLEAKLTSPSKNKKVEDDDIPF